MGTKLISLNFPGKMVQSEKVGRTMEGWSLVSKIRSIKICDKGVK